MTLDELAVASPEACAIAIAFCIAVTFAVVGTVYARIVLPMRRWIALELWRRKAWPHRIRARL